MLTGLEFWHLVSHIIPVYAVVLFGYGSVRIGLLQPPHLPGISRFVSMIGVPFYAFYLLAFNDFYKTSFRLVGADVLQKAFAMTVGCLWWKFSPTGSIDNLINFFMLATLPNTVLIAEALLPPLYGDEAIGKIVTIILLQCFVWYNLCIFMYELRVVLLEEMAERKIKDGEFDLSQQKADQHSPRKPDISIIVNGGSERHHDINLNDSRRASQRFSGAPDAITRTSSAPPGIAALGKVFPALSQEQDVAQAESNEDPLATALSRIGVSSSPNALTAAEIKAATSARNLNFDGDRAENATPAAELVARSRPRDEPPLSNRAVVTDVEALEPSPLRKQRGSRVPFVGRVAVKVVNRLKYAPLIYGSVAGFIYSMLSFKYHWTMPYSVLTSIQLISNGAVGLALFILGTSWASSGKLILCGWRKMLWGMFTRFLISPFIMIVTSLIVGLKGDAYRFAVLQAVIPQGIISFVFAREYNLDSEVFATAAIAQLLIFVPIVIVYYTILDAV